MTVANFHQIFPEFKMDRKNESVSRTFLVKQLESGSALGFSIIAV